MAVSLAVERGLSGSRASVVAARSLSICGPQALEHRLSTYSTWAKLLCSMWDLPRSGIEPISSALASGFFTPELLGKPHVIF